MNKIISNLSLFGILTLVGILAACKDTNSRQTATALPKDTIVSKPIVAENAPKKTKLYAWVNRLRVRAEANKKAEVVEEIPEGDQLLFLNEQSDFTEKINLRGIQYDEPWLKVETASGKVGWVYGGGVKIYAPKVDRAPSPYDACKKLEADGEWVQANECIEEVSQKQSKVASRWVKETPDGVFITLLDGTEVEFLSEKPLYEEGHFLYRYRYYIPRMGYHVLRIFGHEWSAYVLVNDKSGKSIEVFGYPKPSPDFKHLFVSNIDLDAQFEYNGVALMGFTENGLEMIFEKELAEYGASSPIWLDDNTVEMTFWPALDRDDLQKKKVQLIRDDSGDWRFKD